MNNFQEVIGGERRRRRPSHLAGAVTQLKGLDFGDNLGDGDLEASLKQESQPKKKRSPKKRKTASSPSLFTEESSDADSLASSENRGWPVEKAKLQRVRRPKAITGRSSRLAHQLARPSPPTTESVIDDCDEDGEYSIVGSDEELSTVDLSYFTFTDTASVSITPNTSPTTSPQSCLPNASQRSSPDNDISDYYHRTSNTVQVTMTDHYTVQPDIISLFNARFVTPDTVAHKTAKDADAVGTRTWFPWNTYRNANYEEDSPMPLEVRWSPVYTASSSSSGSTSDLAALATGSKTKPAKTRYTKATSRDGVVPAKERKVKGQRRRKPDGPPSPQIPTYLPDVAPTLLPAPSLHDTTQASISVSGSSEEDIWSSTKVLGKRKAVVMDPTLGWLSDEQTSYGVHAEDGTGARSRILFQKTTRNDPYGDGSWVEQRYPIHTTNSWVSPWQTGQYPRLGLNVNTGLSSFPNATPPKSTTMQQEHFTNPDDTPSSFYHPFSV
ncbi:hypothetical protein VNI00_005362 [Paramarasmius palmivorus]|uniref:Uncharacterized protein n=1 Tax=Paramarasmius palmivorus TaxID=297713 RepID=A0AAW0DFR5_9AGAR